MEFLAPMVTSEDGITEVVCGICALELSNKALGIERTEFQGEIAEEMRQRAIEHYKETNQM